MTQYIKTPLKTIVLFTFILGACGGDGSNNSNDGSIDTTSNVSQSGGNSQPGAGGATGGTSGGTAGNTQTGGIVQTGGIAQTQTGGNAQTGGQIADAGVIDTMPNSPNLPSTAEVLQYLKRIPQYVIFVTTPGVPGHDTPAGVYFGWYVVKIGVPFFTGYAQTVAYGQSLYMWDTDGAGRPSIWRPGLNIEGGIAMTVLTNADILRLKIDKSSSYNITTPSEISSKTVRVTPLSLEDWISANAASLAGKTGQDLSDALDILAVQPPTNPPIPNTWQL